MLGLIIWLVICFTWLLYETDWLRVRLPVGITCELSCEWRLADSAITEAMKTELINLSNNGHKLHSQGEFQNNIDPLCGWGYAYQYQHFTPEYKVELIAPGSKYTFRTESTEILRDAFRVYRNPYLKVKIKNAQGY